MWNEAEIDRNKERRAYASNTQHVSSNRSLEIRRFTWGNVMGQQPRMQQQMQTISVTLISVNCNIKIWSCKTELWHSSQNPLIEFKFNQLHGQKKATPNWIKGKREISILLNCVQTPSENSTKQISTKVAARQNTN